MRWAYSQYSSSVSPLVAQTGVPVAAIAAAGTPVFATKGETLVEYWDYAHKIFEWADGGYPNLILDDGGDATLLCVLGPKAEKDGSLLNDPQNEEEEALYKVMKRYIAEKPGFSFR